MPRKPSAPAPGPKVKVRLVPQDVARALARSKGIGIDSAGLLNALIERWGGRDRFAQDIQQEFQCSKPGSMTRQRILEMIARLTVQVTDQEMSRPRPAREMSDEELLVTAGRLLERLRHDEAPAPAPGPVEPQA